MKVVFGKMPIELIDVVQDAASRNINTNKILLLSGFIIVLGVTTIILYKNNKRLKNQLQLIEVQPKE